ncbi:MAG TPA: hypothetical protein PLT08_08835 [Anaerolineales bacterium]|nr:hypothetical protein [Anaerolineales bacterium]
MKKFLSLFFAISLTLSACGTASTQPAPPAQTGTPTVTPTTTQTSTATITPLPTIPTITPTFDVSSIVTVTPANKEACLEENSSVVANFATPNNDGNYELYTPSEILEYLNAGGSLSHLRDSSLGDIVDVTGDGLNEIIYRYGYWEYSILGCKNNIYQSLLNFRGDFGVDLAEVSDLNKNGILEIILYDVVHYGYVNIFIFEWNGSEFNSLIDIGKEYPTGPTIDRIRTTNYREFLDTNNDELEEIIATYDANQLCGGFGDFCDGTPIRKKTTTLKWNGKNYVVDDMNYSLAQYRFQAIQDGDWQTGYGNYLEALTYYKAAIFDNKLDWWSLEREKHERYTYMSQYDPTPVASPLPNPDPAEYPSLAAYAYYRIILLHLVQGQEAEAASAYQTLQDTFGTDQYAAPYIEMTTAFWEAYQSTHKMYDGCAAAIQYAVEHPQILTPLGSDYHGWQSHIYVPADVCPFR